MNNKFIKLFAKYPDYALLTLGSLLSAVGISFTAIATYSQLEKLQASALVFSLAFILETAPGALSSWIAEKYFKKLSLTRALFLAELLGGCLMILPILGILTGSLALLLVAGVIGSATMGFMVPYHKTHMRRVLNDEEVSAATFLSNYVFAITFVFGTLGGTLLLNKVGSLHFYFIDAMTYFISCVLTLFATRLRKHNFTPQEGLYEKSSWKNMFQQMNPAQKKAIVLSSLLVLNCAPAAAILPSIANAHSVEWARWGLALSLAMTLVIMKTVGQILGPMVVDKFDISKVIESKWAVPVCLVTYQLIYFVIFAMENLSFILPLVIVAHIFSNVVFMLGYYSMIRYFNEQEIGSSSSFHYQLSIVILVVSCLWSGWVATRFGPMAVAMLSLGIGVITSVAYINFDKKRHEVSRDLA